MELESCQHCGEQKLAIRMPRLKFRNALRLDCMACGRFCKPLKMKFVLKVVPKAKQLTSLPLSWAYIVPSGKYVNNGSFAEWTPEYELRRMAKQAETRKAAKAKSADPLQDFSRTKRKNRRRPKNRQS